MAISRLTALTAAAWLACSEPWTLRSGLTSPVAVAPAGTPSMRSGARASGSSS
jgi:hypothetical protein